MRLSPDLRRGWRVRIPEHVVAGRYRVPAYDRVIYVRERASAVAIACRMAHTSIRPCVPPWRPWLRETALLAEAEQTVVEQ
jgi:hypothetical protein